MVAREGVDKPVTFNLIRDEIPALQRDGTRSWSGRASRTSTSTSSPRRPVKRSKRVSGNSASRTQGPHPRPARQPRRSAERRRRGSRPFPQEERPGGIGSRARHDGEALRRAPRQRRPRLSRSSYWWTGTRRRLRRSSPERCRITTAAWILGENTFGKGLVQTVFPLTDNTGLALTTAHYYTPSGRLIQRDYSNMSFLDYYYHKNLEHQEPAGREDDR